MALAGSWFPQLDSGVDVEVLLRIHLQLLTHLSAVDPKTNREDFLPDRQDDTSTQRCRGRPNGCAEMAPIPPPTNVAD